MSTIARLEEKKFKPTSQEKPAFNGAAALNALHKLNTMGFKPPSRPATQQRKSTAPGTRALVVELRQLWKGPPLLLLARAPTACTLSIIHFFLELISRIGKNPQKFFLLCFCVSFAGSYFGELSLINKAPKTGFGFVPLLRVYV